MSEDTRSEETKSEEISSEEINSEEIRSEEISSEEIRSEEMMSEETMNEKYAAEAEQAETSEEMEKNSRTAEEAAASRDENTSGEETKSAGAEGAAQGSEEAGESGEAGEAGKDSPSENAGGAKDPKDQKIEELTDRYKRLFAEFDNYRKRTEGEKSGMFAMGERNVLEKLLPVIDNFERALASEPEDLKDNGYVKGVEKIYDSFMSLLKSMGAEPIEAVGKPFDAELHNAVMHVEDETLPENTVTEEFQKGYMFKGKVLRYSMVKVAN